MGFRFGLADLTKKDKLEVGKLLVEWCTNNAAEMRAMIGGFLPQFCAKHKIKLESILHSFIESTISSSSDFDTWFIQGEEVASWQDTVAALIPHMEGDPDLQLSAVLTTLKSAPVPWSPVIQGVFQTGLALSRNSTRIEQRLREQSELAK